MSTDDAHEFLYGPTTPSEAQRARRLRRQHRLEGLASIRRLNREQDRRDYILARAKAAASDGKVGTLGASLL